jgi:hypothetical protein
MTTDIRETAKARREREQREAADELRTMLGDTPRIYTVLRHVSASGMSRDISLMVADGDDIINITYTAATVLGNRVRNSHGHRAIRVGGCGMDMGFHLVYTLSDRLYRETRDRAGYVVDHRWL